MVLIFSDNDDASTNEVIKWLNDLGTKWFRINESDNIAINTLTFEGNQLKCFELKVNNIIIDLVNCNAYWYRRGFLNWSSRIKKPDSFVAYRIDLHYQAELKNIDDFVHKYLETTKIGINSYLKGVNNKTSYLFAAMNAGLNIPDTLITSQKKDLEKFHVTTKRTITKSINEGLVFFLNDLNIFSETSEINKDTFNDLSATFFPSLFQAYVEKFVELRIFFLHDQIYAMAIFSQQNDRTKLDYRNYDDINPNRNVPFELPELVKERLINFMHTIELNCGSIDMIITPNNDYVFLEVNPIGQFGMVSGPCNYGLEQIIAKYLSYGNI